MVSLLQFYQPKYSRYFCSPLYVTRVAHLIFFNCIMRIKLRVGTDHEDNQQMLSPVFCYFLS